MAAPTISDLPVAPVRADAPADFTAKADALMAALQPFVVQANAQADFNDQRATDSESSANASAGSAAAAALSATQAQAQVALAAEQAELATTNGATQVALAADQLALAAAEADRSEAAADSAQIAAAAAGAAAGLPALVGNGGKALVVKLDETGVEFSALGQAIGDTIVTSRTMGSDYLPCDGSIYLQSTYPDLFNEVGTLPDMERTSFRVNSNALPSTGGSAWSHIAYGNGVFVALATSSTVSATSADGITWTQRVFPSFINVKVLFFGGGIFIALNNSDTAYTSVDGITWTARSMPVSADWSHIAYGNGVFVALATSSTVSATSADGITWTQRVAPTSANKPLAYGGGVFVYLPAPSQAYTSTDGINWTVGYFQSTATSWLGISYGNGIFVAAGQPASSGQPRPVIISRDGVSWLEVSAPWQFFDPKLTYGAGLFLLTSSRQVNDGDQGFCAFSKDGRSWQVKGLGAAGSWPSTACGNMSFVSLVSFSTSRNTSSINLTPYDRATQFMVPRLETDTGPDSYIKATEA